MFPNETRTPFVVRAEVGGVIEPPGSPPLDPLPSAAAQCIKLWHGYSQTWVCVNKRVQSDTEKSCCRGNPFDPGSRPSHWRLPVRSPKELIDPPHQRDPALCTGG